MIRCAAVQFQHVPNDKSANLAQIERWCQAAAEQGVQIIAFPEMCVTGYWHVRHLDRDGVAELAEPIPAGPATQKLEDLASRFQMIVAAGLIELAEDGQLYNSYVVAQPDGTVNCHRKLHCFISPHMSSGDQYTTFDTQLGVKLGVLICWDNNLTENARITALAGAEILLAPHQTGGTASRSPHAMGKIDPKFWHERLQNPAALQAETNGDKGRGWLLRWLPSRAHDNGMFILFSNGVGLDDDEVRTGNAMILDCYGRILAEQREPTDAMVVADVDLGLLENCTGRRWIRGRRPELYQPLTVSSGEELDPREARFSTKSTRS